MSHELRSLLRERFGFSSFRPGQEALISAVFAGRDALGVLPTGGGKTLCFQLPAMALEGAVVVVSPLISLMKDQVGRARAVGLRAESVTSVETPGTQRRALKALEEGSLDLLFLSPERLATERTRDLLRRSRISLLAVDEAHCISEWGHDFRPAFRMIARVRPLIAAPVLAVTATATPKVRVDIREVLTLRSPKVVVTSFDRPNIFWWVRPEPDLPARIRHTAALLSRSRGQGATIVYAPTRRQVVNVRRALASLGHPAEAYHAGMEAPERQGVQARFLERRTNLIVATNAFGMGIDRGDVERVVHFALPGSLESYYQEAGRAGRDGCPSVAIGFVAAGDWRVPEGFLDRAFPAPRSVRRVLRRLRWTARRSGGRLEGEALLGKSRSHVPALRWLVRAGAVEANPALVRLVEDGETGHGEGADVPRARLTDRVPNLEALAVGRRQAGDRLRGIRRYVEGRGCRRKALLGYLGEALDRSTCASCDRCAGGRGPSA